ncbi:MAG: shikimate kinase [bacterium]
MLTGSMGSGKSGVGRRVAKLMNLPFLDLDDVIVEKAGMSIPEIFEKEEEEGFRRRESEALRELSRRGRCVLATGGGTVLRPENWKILRALGWVVCLTARPEILFERASRDSNRPLLAGDDPFGSLKKILAVRAPHYAKADLSLDTSECKTADEAAMRMAAMYQEWLEKNFAASNQDQ